MEFKRRKGYRVKTDPQVVGEYCYALEQKKGGKLTPKELVEAARDVNSPLHDEFEWNNTKAAQKYREWQARYIISSIEVKLTYIPSEIEKVDLQIVPKSDGVKFYHTLDLDEGGYENVLTISSDEEKRKKLLDNCLRDVNSFVEKYDTLRSALPKLFEVMDETIENKANIA